ncbi:NAD(P)-dependent oxidoreductase [bacterium]|jgi:nucleoside-diphosphate-sugar epimerase|nr:NAD(P)-dependent oxidoreductase [bacterium]
MAIIIGSSHRNYLINGQNGSVGVLLKNSFKNIKDLNLLKISPESDVLLHLAASTESERILESNIKYLVRVVDYCLDNKIKNIVFFSSVSVYGKQSKLNIKENSGSQYLDLYGSSKLFAEQYLKNISNLNILVLRFPAILTDKSNTYISSILNDLSNNRSICLSNYNKYFNNFISVDDIARFIDNYNFSDKYTVLNFASEQSQTLKDVVLYMRDLLESKSTISYNDNESRYYNVSIEKLKSIFSFSPLDYKISLKRWIERSSESSNIKKVK